jgi:hypothetical protein
MWVHRPALWRTYAATKQTQASEAVWNDQTHVHQLPVICMLLVDRQPSRAHNHPKYIFLQVFEVTLDEQVLFQVCKHAAHAA